MERRLAKAGSREYVGVLRLHEGFSPTQVHAAVRTALRLGSISYDGVKHCLWRTIRICPWPRWPPLTRRPTMSC
jgi:hypothetical protein